MRQADRRGPFADDSSDSIDLRLARDREGDLPEFAVSMKEAVASGILRLIIVRARTIVILLLSASFPSIMAARARGKRATVSVSERGRVCARARPC
jgi:hypothetical protein